MVRLSSPRSWHKPITILVLLVLSGLIVHQAYGLGRYYYYRALLDKGAAIPDEAPPEILFAKAYALDRAGDAEQALRYYRQLETLENPQLAQQAYYNIGTVYLRQAATLWNAQGVGAYAEVLNLVNLAEDAYRATLRLNHRHRSARLNLEYALRIHPPLKEIKKADWQGNKSSVFAILPGIPAGAP